MKTCSLPYATHSAQVTCAKCHKSPSECQLRLLSAQLEFLLQLLCYVFSFTWISGGNASTGIYLSTISHLHPILGVRSNSKGKIFRFFVPTAPTHKAEFWWEKERSCSCHHREQNLRRILNREGELLKGCRLFPESGWAETVAYGLTRGERQSGVFVLIVPWFLGILFLCIIYFCVLFQMSLNINTV